MAKDRLNRREFTRAGINTLALGLASGIALGGPRPFEALQQATSRPADRPSSAAVHRYPGEAKADIWVFAGQSNSQGWGLLKAPVEPDPRILFFNSDNHWELAKEPLNHRFYTWTPAPVEENIRRQREGVGFPGGAATEAFLERERRKNAYPLGGVGPALAFAKHLVKYVDRPIGLMHCGVGGSPIKSWDPTLKSKGMGSNYGAMLERIAMVGGEIKGLAWYQGESDAMTAGAEDAYEQALLQLIDGVRKDTRIPSLPFICVQIGRYEHPYNSRALGWEKVRDVQRRVAFERENVYTISTIDLTLEDSIHLSFEGHQRLGRRLAEIVLTHVYHEPGHATTIGLDSMEVLQPDNRRAMIRVKFKGVNGRLTAGGRPTGFEIRAARPLHEPEGRSPESPIHHIYRVDLDPGDPAAVILGVFDNALINSGGAKFYSLTEAFSIIYGAGLNPYVNLADEKDIPIPAFGPVEVKT